MREVTIITDRRESQVIAPGVRQGVTYRVVAEGPDCYLIRMGGKAVYLEKGLTVEHDDRDDQAARRRGR